MNEGLYRRAGIGLGIGLVLFGLAYLAVIWAYGAFDDDYELVGRFPRAGQGLAPGSDVKYRGVNVGEVGGIELVDRQAEVTLNMDPDFEVPTSAEVVVRPKTIFGEKFVDMTFERDAGGPMLEDGDRIPNTASATEVEDFIDGSNDLFEVIDQEEVAILVTELAEAARGGGEDVARSIDSSAEASSLFADTIEPQLAAMESFAAFQDAIRSTGEDFNTISANSNLSLPEFNANAEAYQRVLRSLRPFAEDFARLLAASRPDIDTIMVEGDNVVRLMLANEGNIADVVNGLGSYVRTFAEGFPQERLPDGTIFAYFKAFVEEGAVNNVICDELAQAPDEFAPLRDAVLALQGEIDCSDSFGPSGAGAPAGAPPRSEAELAASARQLVDSLYGQVAAPDGGNGAGVGTLIEGLAQ